VIFQNNNTPDDLGQKLQVNSYMLLLYFSKQTFMIQAFKIGTGISIKTGGVNPNLSK